MNFTNIPEKEVEKRLSQIEKDQSSTDSLIVANTNADSLQRNTVTEDSDVATNKEEPEEALTFDPSDFTAKDVIAILDTIKNRDKNYSLDPDSVFFGFSTGISFEFVDGIDDASLFMDLNANIGQVIFPGFSAEFGVLSGKFSPDERKRDRFRSNLVEITEDTDSTFILKALRSNEEQVITSQRRFTRAFAAINYLLLHSRQTHSKLYVTGNFTYNRIQFNETSIFGDELTTDTIFSVIPKRDNLQPGTFEPNLVNDTITSKRIEDRSSILLGLKLHKYTPKFEFLIHVLAGPTWINEVRLESNASSGTAISSFERRRIENRNSGLLTYAIQGAVLEKQVIGAKIGFEICDFLNVNREEPQYYFFVSKQFSMSEFFKLFTP